MKLAALKDSTDKKIRDLQSEFKATLDTVSSEKVDLVSEKLTMEVQLKELQAEREVWTDPHIVHCQFTHAGTRTQGLC